MYEELLVYSPTQFVSGNKSNKCGYSFIICQLTYFLLFVNFFKGQVTDFGDTLIDCVTPVSRGRNFCRNQINNLNDPNAPDSVLRYRTITGICNNIEPGQATVGASETVLPRLRRKL